MLDAMQLLRNANVFEEEGRCSWEAHDSSPEVRLWRNFATRVAKRGRNRGVSKADGMMITAVLASTGSSRQRIPLVAARAPPGT